MISPLRSWCVLSHCSALGALFLPAAYGICELLMEGWNPRELRKHHLWPPKGFHIPPDPPTACWRPRNREEGLRVAPGPVVSPQHTCEVGLGAFGNFLHISRNGVTALQEAPPGIGGEAVQTPEEGLSELMSVLPIPFTMGPRDPRTGCSQTTQPVLPSTRSLLAEHCHLPPAPPSQGPRVTDLSLGQESLQLSCCVTYIWGCPGGEAKLLWPKDTEGPFC
jgi:hypothetical protein